jgi:hypothetical protein
VVWAEGSGSFGEATPGIWAGLVAFNITSFLKEKKSFIRVFLI